MSAVLFIDEAYYLTPENKMEMILERKKKWKITEKNCLLFLQATRKKWNAIQAESRTEEKSEYEYPLLLTGNPGNGKITVANLMGRILKSIGIIKKVI